MIAKDLGLPCSLPYLCPDLLRVGTPEDVHDGLREMFTGVQNSAGEYVPAPADTAVGLTFKDREAGIEKQYALLRPFGQVAGGGNLAADVAVEFLEYVAKRRGEFLAWIY